MDVRSLPFTEDTVGEVWVENPSALRVMQWHNVSFSNGMVQLEMELSNEPQLGEWKVCCRLKGEETRSAFRVDQYGKHYLFCTFSGGFFINTVTSASQVQRRNRATTIRISQGLQHYLENLCSVSFVRVIF